jgi:hypothetical protein
MARFLPVIIASVCVLGSSAAFAYKLEPLNKEQRTELRERSDRLVAERDREAHRSESRSEPAHKASPAKQDGHATSSRR